MINIQLCDIYNCTQCHACEEVCPKQCISFTVSKDGFSVPTINHDVCIECGLCMKSCHQLMKKHEKKMPLSTYAAWSLDDSVRGRSSSGGVFTEIANYVLEHNGVVVGSIMDNKLKVRHVFAETLEELIPMCGSKYVQSFTKGIYTQTKELLKIGRLVLFTGTPCQVAGLYSFLKKDYENLLTCDLICHGVPSQKSFDVYCDRVGFANGKTEEIRFRYTEGWGLQMAMRSHLVSPSKNGEFKWVNISPRKSYYLRAFTKGLMFNEACYSCHYATPDRVSDITMADYWGVGTEKPFNHLTNKGVSLLLINTKKAESVIAQCGNLFIEKRSLSEAIQGNHNLSKCSDRPKERDTYCKDAESMSINALLKKYEIMPSFRDYLRSFKMFLLS